ncbi:hypothetical protein CU102_26620 [Phyllobacterium brassicacearum]|uniref:Uncharacterized protein n=1 Tax=Phyllobacterium brassicacearum TaxID=314235 RepID=A0A2P7B5J2_9HYPH|nr:hypothetical protein CU102_26620 [Phyllobacterium brassicacearum]
MWKVLSCETKNVVKRRLCDRIATDRRGSDAKRRETVVGRWGPFNDRSDGVLVGKDLMSVGWPLKHQDVVYGARAFL